MTGNGCMTDGLVILSEDVCSAGDAPSHAFASAEHQQLSIRAHLVYWHDTP